MKKAFKIFTLFLLFNFGGCITCNCDFVKKYIDIQGFEVEVEKITDYYSDSSTSAISFNTNDSIDFDKLQISLTARGNYYGQSSFQLGSFFVNSLYACSCAPHGYLGSKEQISEITILSNNPFLAAGNSADTLNQYFKISGYYGTEHFKPTDLVTFLSYQPRALDEINLTLKTPPTGSKEHIFRIIYKQTNGETYEITTPKIKFN